MNGLSEAKEHDSVLNNENGDLKGEINDLRKESELNRQSSISQAPQLHDDQLSRKVNKRILWIAFILQSVRILQTFTWFSYRDKYINEPILYKFSKTETVTLLHLDIASIIQRHCQM